MMRLLMTVCLIALPSLSHGLPIGMEQARLLPGWTDADGNRITALELRLKPGWKTYWRSPGDSGLPPQFDWTGSTNLARATPLWPAPQAIDSGNEISLGFHDELILPFVIEPVDPDQPVDLALEVEMGLCERICVPGQLSLRAEAPGTQPDPRIVAAMESAPKRAGDTPDCRLENIADGVRITLEAVGAPIRVAAIELVERPDVWVSSVDIDRMGQLSTLTADLVPPEGKPFDVPTDDLRVTMVTDEEALELTGCDPAG